MNNSNSLKAIPISKLSTQAFYTAYVGMALIVLILGGLNMLKIYSAEKSLALIIAVIGIARGIGFAVQAWHSQKGLTIRYVIISALIATLTGMYWFQVPENGAWLAIVLTGIAVALILSSKPRHAKGIDMERDRDDDC